jgi:hypothetical protein
MKTISGGCCWDCSSSRGRTPRRRNGGRSGREERGRAGRARALGKLTSRTSIGTITLSTPEGTSRLVEISTRHRTIADVIKVDLSSLGAGQLVIDQRFDGTAGCVMDSLQAIATSPAINSTICETARFPAAAQLQGSWG